MYTAWADTAIARVNNILNAARRGHVDAVKSRIENVKPLASVVEVTKNLFEVSKVRFDPETPLCFLTAIAHIFKGNRSSRGQSF